MSHDYTQRARQEVLAYHEYLVALGVLGGTYYLDSYLAGVQAAGEIEHVQPKAFAPSNLTHHMAFDHSGEDANIRYGPVDGESYNERHERMERLHAAMHRKREHLS